MKSVVASRLIFIFCSIFIKFMIDFLEKGSLRGQIIATLGEEWPLSSKELYSRLTRAGVSVSYQAVHKALLDLVSEKVLEKIDKSYKIRVLWLNELNSFSNHVLGNYSKNMANQVLFFDTLEDLDSFLIETGKQLVESQPHGKLCLKWIHFWIPLFEDKKVYREMNELVAKTHYFAITPSNTPLDVYCANFWNKRGAKVKTNADISSLADYLIFGNFVLQVFYPKKTKDLLHDYYNRTKKMEELDLDEIYKNVFEVKGKITVLVTLNETLANQLQADLLSFFKAR